MCGWCTWVPDGMKVDPFFNIDLNKLPTGPRVGMTC